MKIFAFDMDGTIVNDEDSLMPSTVLALKKTKELNHINIIATGRPFVDVLRTLKEHKKYFDYIICNNGSYIVNLKTEAVERLEEIPRKVIEKAIKVGEDNNFLMTIHGNTKAERFFLDSIDNIYWESENFKEFKKFKEDFLEKDKAISWSKTQHIGQFSLRSTPETISKIAPIFNDFSEEVSIHIANTYYLDINPKGASKWSGISSIAKKHQIESENIISFGDSGNDLQMLKGSGWEYVWIMEAKMLKK